MIFTITLLAVLLGCLPADAGPLRNQTAGHQAKAMQQIKNPFCSVTTLVVPKLADQARASMLPNGEPVIYLARRSTSDPAYMRFLLAHECCHHTRGHVKRLYKAMAHKGPILMVGRAMVQIELDADCCAARALARLREHRAIKAAEQVMSGYGNRPTGSNHPRGNARKAVIMKCAAGR